MSVKTIIEIDEHSGCKVIMCAPDGSKNNKKITYKTLLELLNSAADEENIVAETIGSITTDILPGDQYISTIQVKEMPSISAKWYILLREEKPVKMQLKDITFNNVAVPKTIFAVKVCNNKCVSLRIGCVKDRYITDGTIMYQYPYSNVFDTRSICLGGNRINDFDLVTLNNLVMIPEMFFAMGNNNDGYAGSNSSEFKYEELLELMSGAKFDYAILKKSNYTFTYRDFINSLR